MFPPSPAPKSGVRIEEITDDDKLANETDLSKRPKKKNNDNSQRQIVLKTAASVPVLESEDEDGFPVSSPAKSGLSSKEETEEFTEKGTSGQVKRKKTKGDSGDTNSAKRKKDDSVKDGNHTRETSQPVNLSSPTPEVVPEEDGKKAKKNKKKKLREREAKMKEASKSSIQPEEANNQRQASEKAHDTDAGSAAGNKQLNEKDKKKNKQQVNGAAAVTDKNGSPNEREKAEAKPSQTRTFPNGLVIEELEMGRPDGKRAAPGKKVSVRYIGKLKKNGKIFDSNIGKAPFKFRLGVGEVIKGWDVGVNGMRVGDKRRLTIPPAMGYGVRGAGGAIPPNAWLLFDVELVDAS